MRRAVSHQTTRDDPGLDLQAHSRVVTPAAQAMPTLVRDQVMRVSKGEGLESLLRGHDAEVESEMFEETESEVLAGIETVGE